MLTTWELIDVAEIGRHGHTRAGTCSTSTFSSLIASQTNACRHAARFCARVSVRELCAFLLQWNTKTPKLLPIICFQRTYYSYKPNFGNHTCPITGKMIILLASVERLFRVRFSARELGAYILQRKSKTPQPAPSYMVFAKYYFYQDKPTFVNPVRPVTGKKATLLASTFISPIY